MSNCSQESDTPLCDEPERITQTEFGEHGNCQSACIAMMLGLPLSDVPNWSAMAISDNMKYAEQRKWLHARGWHILTLCPYQALPWPPAHGFYIAGGASTRGFRHSVIFKDGKLWHDPHPSREGIVGDVQDVDILVPLPGPFAVSLGEQPTGSLGLDGWPIREPVAVSEIGAAIVQVLPLQPQPETITTTTAGTYPGTTCEGMRNIATRAPQSAGEPTEKMLRACYEAVWIEPKWTGEADQVKFAESVYRDLAPLFAAERLSIQSAREASSEPDARERLRKAMLFIEEWSNWWSYALAKDDNEPLTPEEDAAASKMAESLGARARDMVIDNRRFLAAVGPIGDKR